MSGAQNRRHQTHEIFLTCALALVFLSDYARGDENAARSFEEVLESGGKSEKFPRFFDEKTMRVITKDDPRGLGYAAFIPPRKCEYDAANDPSLPLARRINAGYILPNHFKPKEWAPLRKYFSTPPLEENSNGVLMSSRYNYRPTSWYSACTAMFGKLGKVVKLGDHIHLDPLMPHYKFGINSVASPINIAGAFNWAVVGLLPENWMKWPYIPWSIWRPWKLSFCTLPSQEILSSVNLMFRDPALRPQPSARYPWFQERKNKVMVEKPSEREQDLMSEWPIWASPPKRHAIDYPDREVCLVLAGSATITPKGSKKPIKIQAGDKVSISAGSSCEWDIPEPLMLHYNYGY